MPPFSLLFLLSLFFSSVSAQCPSGWVPSAVQQNKCYLVVARKANWFDAESYCQTINPGAHLTSVCSAFENANIDATVVSALNAPYNEPIWIGLSDIETSNTFEWIDGNDCSYNNWSPGQPDTSQSSQCVTMTYGGGKWAARNCTTEYYFVCDVFNASSTATSPQPFTQEVAIFMALSQRANETDYHLVQNATADWIRTLCSEQTVGGVIVYMPRSQVVAACTWTDVSFCGRQLMNTPFESVRMNASEIMETDYDFAPDVLNYARRINYEEGSSQHHVMLLVTDFISIDLNQESHFFTNAKHHNLILDIVVVLDNPRVLNRSLVQELYVDLMPDVDHLVTPPNFSNVLDSLLPSEIPCK